MRVLEKPKINLRDVFIYLGLPLRGCCGLGRWTPQSEIMKEYCHCEKMENKF